MTRTPHLISTNPNPSCCFQLTCHIINWLPERAYLRVQSITVTARRQGHNYWHMFMAVPVTSDVLAGQLIASKPLSSTRLKVVRQLRIMTFSVTEANGHFARNTTSFRIFAHTTWHTNFVVGHASYGRQIRYGARNGDDETACLDLLLFPFVLE